MLKPFGSNAPLAASSKASSSKPYGVNGYAEIPVDQLPGSDDEEEWLLGYVSLEEEEEYDGKGKGKSKKYHKQQ